MEKEIKMATAKLTAIELRKNDGVDVWVMNSIKLTASISVKVDDKGNVSILYAGDNVTVEKVDGE
jgi:hypothetical protein